MTYPSPNIDDCEANPFAASQAVAATPVMSESQVKQLLENSAATLRAEYGKLPNDDPATVYCQQRLATLLFDVSPSDLPKVTILGRNGIGGNAFACTSSDGRGEILITPEMLLSFTKREQLDALLLHETIHLLEKHSLIGANAPSLLRSIGSQRLSEYRADGRAFMMMADLRRGSNPEGLISLLTLFGTECPLGWDAAHGSVGARIQNLRMIQLNVDLNINSNPADHIGVDALTDIDADIIEHKKLNALPSGNLVDKIFASGPAYLRDPQQWARQVIEKLRSELAPDEIASVTARAATLLYNVEQLYHLNQQSHAPALAAAGAVAEFVLTTASKYARGHKSSIAQVSCLLSLSTTPYKNDFTTSQHLAIQALIDGKLPISEKVKSEVDFIAQAAEIVAKEPMLIVQIVGLVPPEHGHRFNHRVLKRLFELTIHGELAFEPAGRFNLKRLDKVGIEMVATLARLQFSAAQRVSTIYLSAIAKIPAIADRPGGILKFAKTHEWLRDLSLFGTKYRDVTEQQSADDALIVKLANQQNSTYEESFAAAIYKVESAQNETEALLAFQQIFTNLARLQLGRDATEADRQAVTNLFAKALPTFAKNSAKFLGEEYAFIPKICANSLAKGSFLSILSEIIQHDRDLPKPFLFQLAAKAHHWLPHSELTTHAYTDHKLSMEFALLKRLSTDIENSSGQTHQIECVVETLTFLRNALGVTHIEGWDVDARTNKAYGPLSLDPIRTIVIEGLTCHADNEPARLALIRAGSVLCEDPFVAERIHRSVRSRLKGTESFDALVARLRAFIDDNTGTLQGDELSDLDTLARTPAQLETATELLQDLLMSESRSAQEALGTLVCGESINKVRSEGTLSSLEILEAGISSGLNSHSLRQFCADTWIKIYQDDLDTKIRGFEYMTTLTDAIVTARKTPSEIGGNTYVSAASLERSILNLSLTHRTLLLREVLSGPGGVLTTQAGRQRLCDLLVDAGVAVDDPEAASEVLKFTKCFVENAPQEDLAILLTQVLAERFFNTPPGEPPSWSSIAIAASRKQPVIFGLKYDELYRQSEGTKYRAILDQAMSDTSTSAKSSKSTKINKSSIVERVVQEHFLAPQITNLLAGQRMSATGEATQDKATIYMEQLLTAAQVGSNAAPVKLSAARFMVEIGKGLRPPGVRIVQLAGQFFAFRPEYREASHDIYDSTKAQLKISVWHRLKQVLPAYAAQIAELGDRRGGGAMYSVFDVDLKDDSQEVVKVLSPNAWYLTERVSETLAKTAYDLAKSDPRYAAGTQLVAMVKEWIYAEVTEVGFEARDAAVRSKNHGLQFGTSKIETYVPKGIFTGTVAARREERLSGKSLGRVAQNDRATAAKLLTASFELYLQQLFIHTYEIDGQQVRLVRSDISEGNDFIISPNQLGIIDRSNYLIFPEQEANDLMNIFMCTPSKRGQAVVDYFSRIPENPTGGDINTEESRSLLAAKLNELLAQSSIIAVPQPCLSAIRDAGFTVPLRISLLLKNFNAYMSMAKQYGADLGLTALGIA